MIYQKIKKTRGAKGLLVAMWVAIFACSTSVCSAQTAMINVEGRSKMSLNGKWQGMIDLSQSGEYRGVWKEPIPQNKHQFIEYSFDGGIVLDVPGDFNSQYSELENYEGVVWYKRKFDTPKQNDKRYFVHFAAVNYKSDIYFNGEFLGSHEGGFTPFQFEVTALLKAKDNSLVVKTSNIRDINGIPATGFDWFNYGGITRDVDLVCVPKLYIDDYFVQLAKGSTTNLSCWVQLSDKLGGQSVVIEIPELKIKKSAVTDANGKAQIEIKTKPTLWEPANPKLYNVVVSSEADRVADEIGFRTIEVVGSEIHLNGKPVFFSGINFHEENPIRRAKASNKYDVLTLLEMTGELGCNMVRLAHYPHSEFTVKEAERRGLLVWSELPVYQHIAFTDPVVIGKMNTMLEEMIKRDRNRAAVFVWALSNETYDSTPNRTKALADFTTYARTLDNTRLYTSVSCTQEYRNNAFRVYDPLYDAVDFMSVNEYLGWYVPFQGEPTDVTWSYTNPDKPLFISEFGGESLYGSNFGAKDEADSWSEEYHEQIMINQTKMFEVTPNLVGVSPWILADFRSPGRMQPLKQSGWNRKGLYSDRGDKKRAFFVMKNWYEKQKK